MTSIFFRNVPKFSDRQVWVNSVDPDQTAPGGAVWSGLHCLPFRLHFLDPLISSETTLFQF